MYGLIIKKKWLDLILSGKKTLEIRGSNTKHKDEPIYLIESGSNGLVRGKCIINATFPISCSDWSEYRDKHCVDISYKELKSRYNSPYAWELTNVEKLENPFYFKPPKGAIIWIKNVERI